jgi:hypothetical protein
MFIGEPASGSICGLPCFGQVHGIVTPIALVRPTFHQSFSLEFVDVGRHSARECSESHCKRALTHAWLTGQEFEDACVRGNELQHGQPDSEPRGRMCAELGKQGCCGRIRLSIRYSSLADACHM